MLADGLYVMVSVTVCMRKVAAGCWWHSDVLYIGPSLVAFMIAGTVPRHHPHYAAVRLGRVL